MTDTNRPTVEALIARLEESAGFDGPGYPVQRDLKNGAADVLGALLTERDDMTRGAQSWKDESDRNAELLLAARAQIAEALAECNASPNYTEIVRIRAILSRGAQDAAEPWTDPEPFTNGIHRSAQDQRIITPGWRRDPRTREQYDAEGGNRG